MRAGSVLSTAVLLICAAVLAGLLPSPLWTFLARVAFLYILISLACRWFAGRVRAEMSAWPEHPESGDFAGIDVRLRAPVPGLWRIEATAQDAELTTGGWFAPGRQRAHLEHKAVRRGVHVYRVRISYRDPLGLLSRRMVFSGEVELSVRPRTVPLPDLGARFGARGPQVGQRHAQRSDAPSGVRRYLPGDRLAEVHWPQTLRMGETQVRDAYTRGTVLRTIALDTRRGAYPDEQTFELAVGVAASLALSAARRGEAVGLLAGDAFVPARLATAARLMDVLTRVERTDAAMPGSTGALIYVGTAQGAAALRTHRPLAFAVAVGRDAQGEDLCIRDWPALYALARGARAAR